MDFQFGDIVEAFGVRGVVLSTESTTMKCPILVEFSTEMGPKQMYFTSQGQLYPWTNERSLEFVSRPPKLTKKDLFQVIIEDTKAPGPLYKLTSALFESLDDCQDYMARKYGSRFNAVALGPKHEVEVKG